MSALTLFLLVLCVLLVAGTAATVALGVYVGRRAVRAGRVATRQVNRARREARAVLPGPAQAVHAERARVHREVSSALAAFDLARRTGRPVAMFAAHAAALRDVGARLDVDLAVVAAEPATLVRSAYLTDLRPRIDTFAGACAHLRHGVLLAGDTYADAALAHAARELSDQVEYLVARSGAYRDLTRF